MDFLTRFVRGRAEAMEGRYADARDDYSIALRNARGGDRLTVLGAIMQLDFALSDRTSAESHAKAALTLSPDHPFANYIMGSIMLGREQYASAEAYLDRAICYEALHDLAKADADYTAAIALDPMLPQPWYNRGNLYLLADRYKDAIADFEQELALNPQSADARVGIGIAHAKMGDYEAAWKDFFIVTDEIHDNNEAALANQKIMMDAVQGKKK